MNTKLIKVTIGGLFALLVGILAFYIIFNAGWIIGDDSIVIRKTGWWHFFTPADTVIPSEGRFFPCAYVIYNILPILGLYSVNAHFALHTLVFVLFCAVSLWSCYKAVETKQLAWQDGTLVLSAAVLCVARAYCNFLDAYSTIWVDYTLVMVWALCCYYVHTKHSKAALVIGLLSVTYLTYCLETNFVFPLCYGIFGLLFTCNKSTKWEKTYLWCLVGVGVVFILLYFFICYLHIEEVYDGSHGQETTIFGNAIKMFLAQKVLWVVLLLVCWRAYRIFVRKEEYEFWDTIMLTGCAYCCGCAVMKLNWVLYYSLASLYMIPAVVHYLHKYLATKWAWIIMLGLAMFTLRKVPNYINSNQKDRKQSAEAIGVLVNQYQAGNKLYWYAPNNDREWCYDFEQRAWLYSCLKTQFAWQVEEEFYDLSIVESFENRPGIYILSRENDKLYPDINNAVVSAGELLIEDGMRGFSVVIVQ